MSEKMWAGRFSRKEDERVNDFNSSIRFDCRMYKQDIEGSIAHARMLARQSIISAEDAEKIEEGLLSIMSDIRGGKLAFDPGAEDIHMFVEAELTRRIGEAGKRLHTARSRNDQVALDLKMYLREETGNIARLLIETLEATVKKAEENLRTVMPGYTHLQRAQPVTFAHHMSAYAEMFARDLKKLKNAAENMDECPLGSCALAGTTYNTDRMYTAKQLGFDRPCANSLDGVSDRDFVIELAAVLSLIMTHLSRLAEEIILWCSWEFKFIELDDAYATGSSIMPQKKNPDVAELIRGKAGRVFGSLAALLTMMKGLPLAYDKDMQEDKEAIFDAVDTVKLCLSTLTPMLSTMTVNGENMLAACKKGFVNATDMADYLVKKGMPFRSAYKIVGTLVGECVQKGVGLEELPLKELKKKSELFDEDVFAAIDILTCVTRRESEGGPAPEAVERGLSSLEKRLTPLKEYFAIKRK